MLTVTATATGDVLLCAGLTELACWPNVRHCLPLPERLEAAREWARKIERTGGPSAPPYAVAEGRSGDGRRRWGWLGAPMEVAA